MSRWRELAEKRRQAHACQIRPVVSAQQCAAADPHHLLAEKTGAPETATPKMPELPKIEPTNISGNFGYSGTGGGRENKGDPIDVLALWRWPLSDSSVLETLPDPVDLLERLAILEADGVPRHEADRQALTEAGYASWGSLAAAWRDAIGRAVFALPPHGTKTLSSRHLARLIAATGEFCGGSHFPLALANGWHFEELFGINPVAPLVRLDHWGLIPLLALSLVPAQVTVIHRDAAELRCASGAIQRLHRRVSDGAVLWWKLT